MGRPDALPGRCQGDWQRRDEHLQELRYAHSQAPESMAFAAASAWARELALEPLPLVFQPLERWLAAAGLTALAAPPPEVLTAPERPVAPQGASLQPEWPTAQRAEAQDLPLSSRLVLSQESGAGEAAEQPGARLPQALPELAWRLLAPPDVLREPVPAEARASRVSLSRPRPSPVSQLLQQLRRSPAVESASARARRDQHRSNSSASSFR
jgi:hypothetical protein